jgi:FG-GAP repeat
MRTLLVASFVVVGAVSGVVSGIGSASAERIDQLTEHKLFAPDAQRFGLYGYASAVNGNRMVIGAFLTDGVVPQTGAAYVYQRIDGDWIVQAKLIAPDGQEGEIFGTSVAVDGQTVVVGAPGAASADGTRVGAAYVYRLVAEQWILEAKLFASDPRESGNFGFDQGVSIQGDTLVVAAAGPENGEEAITSGGAVYVFTRHGSTWTQTARLANPEGDALFSFGNSVSLSGKTLVVGASSSDEAAGAAYVFRLQHGGWVEEARLIASDPTPGALFGFSTAIDGDTLAIGAASGLSDAGIAAGSAYVFERSHTGWTQTAHLVPPGAKAGDAFGRRLGIGGGTLAVGSSFETNAAGVKVGAVHVYQDVHHAWTEQIKLFPSDGTRRGQFACSLAMDRHTLVVGNGLQPSATGQAFAGEAYTYDLHDD